MEKIYCCIEDSEIAIDDFVLENETFPVMEEDTEHICFYCSEPSAYVLSKKNKKLCYNIP